MPQRALAAELQNKGQGTQAGIKVAQGPAAKRSAKHYTVFGYLLDAAAPATNPTAFQLTGCRCTTACTLRLSSLAQNVVHRAQAQEENNGFYLGPSAVNLPSSPDISHHQLCTPDAALAVAGAVGTAAL